MYIRRHVAHINMPFAPLFFDRWGKKEKNEKATDGTMARPYLVGDALAVRDRGRRVGGIVHESAGELERRQVSVGLFVQLFARSFV